VVIGVSVREQAGKILKEKRTEKQAGKILKEK